MKICLLDCSAPFLIDENVFPPLGLLTVGTALQNDHHEVVIRDEPDDSHYFGISPTTAEYDGALALLHQIKSQDKRNRVVIGGPHAIANPDQCLIDGFDTVVIGDGERISSKTFEAGGIVDLGMDSLDAYPLANRNLINIDKYTYEINDRPATTLMTSRGCPYQCAFCTKTNNHVRFYGVDRVRSEITYLQEKCGYDALMIFDDIFIINRIRATKIANTLRERGILWRCFVRGDLIVHHGQEFTDVMRESGCVEVALGIESGSSRILKIINKGESVGTLLHAVKILKQSGIRVKGLFIIGLPGEDRNSILETREFLEEAQLDDADFTIYQPYPGSPIWDNKEAYDISWEDLPLDQQFYKGKPGEYKCAVSTSALNQRDIVEARDEMDKFFNRQKRQTWKI